MRSLLTLLLGLSCLLDPGPAFSAPEPYGQRYVSAGDRAFTGGLRDVVSPEPSRVAELRVQGERLLEQIQLLEYEQGPYGTGLAESFGDLARVFDEAGDKEGAMAARERALHLLRVNEGLSSPAQGPLVRDILDSLRRDGDFEGLDARYKYFFRLYGAGRPPWTDLRWSALLEYLAWQRQALVLGLGGDVKGRLYDLYEQQNDLLEAHRDGEAVLRWERFRDVAMSQLDTYYMVDSYIEPREVMSQSQQWDYRRTDDPADFDLQQERLDNLHRALRSRVRKLLDEVLAVIPEADTRERAKVQLALADWLQWQGVVRQARTRYEALWQSLMESGNEDLADAWFSKPVPLPVSGAFLVNDQPASTAVPMGVDISESGRVRVDPADVPASLERTAARLRRLLSATRFRPKIVDGQVAASRLNDSAWILLDP